MKSSEPLSHSLANDFPPGRAMSRGASPLAFRPFSLNKTVNSAPPEGQLPSRREPKPLLLQIKPLASILFCLTTYLKVNPLEEVSSFLQGCTRITCLCQAPNHLTQ